ncbi:MAG TPA: YwiC-like family protein [Thermoanaerobaculia bacterium]|nr:YwiC-like family protein [Thermoanaerobaculia bacterium]
MSSGATLPLIRPLALPVEHGAWSFLLEPIALGLLVAPSVRGLLIAIGAVAVFLVRHPAKLMITDWRRKRYPRTAVCEALVAIYGAVAVTAFAFAFGRALIPLLFAVPFAVVVFVSKRNRSLVSELCGAIAPAAVVVAIAGSPLLGVLVLCRSIPAVLYVRSALRGESRMAMLAAHAVAIVIAALISWFAVIPMALLFARTLIPTNGVRAQTIGMREIAYGAMFVGLTAIGWSV